MLILVDFIFKVTVVLEVDLGILFNTFTTFRFIQEVRKLELTLRFTLALLCESLLQLVNIQVFLCTFRNFLVTGGISTIIRMEITFIRHDAKSSYGRYLSNSAMEILITLQR